MLRAVTANRASGRLLRTQRRANSVNPKRLSGAGQAAAEVALASVAHLRVHELDLERLQMVAWKSVWDVITTSAYGVGDPIRLSVIQPG